MPASDLPLPRLRRAAIALGRREDLPAGSVTATPSVPALIANVYDAPICCRNWRIRHRSRPASQLRDGIAQF